MRRMVDTYNKAFIDIDIFVCSKSKFKNDVMKLLLEVELNWIYLFYTYILLFDYNIIIIILNWICTIMILMFNMTWFCAVLF